MRGVLQGYDRRYDRLVDWVAETEGVFRDDLLGEFSVADLLIAPISETADQWRIVIRRHRIDAVDIDRFRRSLARTPSMQDRLFTDARARLRRSEGRSRAVAGGAVRVPEAVMKAMGLGLGAFGFHDVWVDRANPASRTSTSPVVPQNWQRNAASPPGTCRSPTPIWSPSPTSLLRDHVTSSACCRSSLLRKWRRSTPPPRVCRPMC